MCSGSRIAPQAARQRFSPLNTYWNLFVGRTNDFAQQRNDGGYWRVGRSLTLTDLANHLDGQGTLGSYVISEKGQCRSAVFDADSANGLQVLRQVQAARARQRGENPQGVLCPFAGETWEEYLQDLANDQDELRRLVNEGNRDKHWPLRKIADHAQQIKRKRCLAICKTVARLAQLNLSFEDEPEEDNGLDMLSVVPCGLFCGK